VVRGLTRSELETSCGAKPGALSEVILLDGVPPVALLESSRPKGSKSTHQSHDEHDARSRRLALAIATKIKRDPGLIDFATDRIADECQRVKRRNCVYGATSNFGRTH
jgi:hypothetical protein